MDASKIERGDVIECYPNPSASARTGTAPASGRVFLLVLGWHANGAFILVDPLNERISADTFGWDVGKDFPIKVSLEGPLIPRPFITQKGECMYGAWVHISHVVGAEPSSIDLVS